MSKSKEKQNQELSRIEFEIHVAKGQKRVELIVTSKYPISFDEIHAVIDEIQRKQIEDEELKLN